MVVASFSTELKPTGSFPVEEKGQTVITGVATTSFGFELELPPVERDVRPGSDNHISEVVRKVQDLLTLTSEDT